jgi:hypothetical protein
VIDNIVITHQNLQYVNRQTEYKFGFTVEADIPQNGKIKFTFPPNRVLNYSSTNMTCKETTTNTLYNCTPTFSATTGLTSALLSGLCPTAICTAPVSYVIVLAGKMKNPASVISITGNFTIETLTTTNFIVS